MTKNLVFVSYSHQDKIWLERLQKALKPFYRKDEFVVWNDTQIGTGDKWRNEIDQALQQASVAVLLVSIDFLASDFIDKKELPPLLAKAEKGGLRIVWVPIGECAFDKTPIGDYQAAWSPKNPLKGLKKRKRDEALTQIARKIDEAATEAKEGIPPTPNFPVLLLTTDKDLKKARAAVAEHLKTVLSMNVMESSAADPPDVSPFELVILIQAWWWDGGRAVEAWKQAISKKRLLFLVDENADWPSFKDIENKAIPAVTEFREKNQPTECFQGPGELPEIVGRLAEEKRRSTAPQQSAEFGLTDTERAYLQFRLGNWKYGHSGGKQFPTEEVYGEDLYISIDGISPRWLLEKQGSLVPQTEEGKGRKPTRQPGEAEEELQPARLPLARWASLQKPSWLVLTGAPGAGKTVFLTRFAMAVASILLGRKQPLAKLEPHLDLEGIRRARIPVPVVLEASRLGGRPLNSLGDLTEAVADELGSANGAHRPDPAEVADHLKSGRYLLLIDALDEIAVGQKRRKTLRFLKSLQAIIPDTRIVLTTRSARYTGKLALGPEFEVVRVSELNQNQINAFCRRFRLRKEQTPDFEKGMLKAVRGLAALNRPQDGSLVDTPLLLTSVCMVYSRLKRLPNDRVELCHLMVEGLCCARHSEDEDKGWFLDPKEKRRLLERLALAMQSKGKQEMSSADALKIIAEAVPEAQTGERDRIDCYLRWLAEHTGLLYFQQDEQGDEQIRFFHRLFREYLAASRLTRDACGIEALIIEIWKKKWLTNPFWLDAMRLLPGILNSEEKATAMLKTIQGLANKNIRQRGSLLAVLAATVVESKHLFGQHLPALAEELAAYYEKEGSGWETKNRLLLLENLGFMGDPRLGMEKKTRWIRIESGQFTMGDEKRGWSAEEPEHTVTITRSFYLGKYSVTNQEYAAFVENGGYQNRAFWSDAGWAAREKNNWSEPRYWNDPKWNGPNQPVVGVSWFEAEAYCNWLTHRLETDPPEWWEPALSACLPTEACWEYAAKKGHGGSYPWGKPRPTPDLANFDESGLGGTSPVGAYPSGATADGVLDMAGNVWEWCRDVWDEKAYKTRKGSVEDPITTEGDQNRRAPRGGSWVSDAGNLRASYRVGFHAWVRVNVFGFRVCLCGQSSSEHG